MQKGRKQAMCSKTKQMEEIDTLAALKCAKLQVNHKQHIFAVVFHSPNLEECHFTEVKSV